MVSCHGACFSTLRIKRTFLRRTVLEARKDVMNDQVSISTANIRGAFGAFFIPGMYTALWAGFVPYLKAKLSIGEDVFVVLNTKIFKGLIQSFLSICNEII